MKALGTFVLGFTMAALMAAPTVSATTTHAAQRNTVKADDDTLTKRIDAKIDAVASLKKYDIDVDVENGVATLTGEVRTEAEKLRAGREAKVPGVTRVDNQITIDENAGTSTANRAGNATRGAVGTAANTTREGVGVAVDKTKEGLSKTGEVISDSWITTKVNAKFVGEDLLKGSHIKVDTSNHVVTLTGTIPTQAGRDRAVAIARETDGVTKVIDALTIK